MVWMGIEWMMSLCDLVFMMLLPTFQLGKRDGIQKWHIAAYLIFISTVLTIYNYYTSNSISSMFLVLFVVVYVLYACKGKMLSKIFWIVFPFSTIYFIEMVIIDILIDLNQITINEIAQQTGYRLILMGAVKTIEAVLLVVAYRHHLSIGKAGKRLILPISSTLVLLLVLDILGIRIWYLAIVFLVINSYYLAWILKTNQDNRQLLAEAEREKQRVLLEEHMRLKMQNGLESLFLRQYMKRYQDDVQRSLQLIWELMKTNQIPEMDIVLEEHKKIQKYFMQVYDTGNHFLDIILATKDATAQERGISFKVDIETPLEGSMDYIKIGNIVIHLADNAIEGIDRIPKSESYMEDRKILFSMARNKSIYQIEMQNPTNGSDIPPLEVLLSDENNGKGIKAVQEIVDELGGKFEITHLEGDFIAYVELPIQELMS